MQLVYLAQIHGDEYNKPRIWPIRILCVFTDTHTQVLFNSRRVTLELNDENTMMETQLKL